MSINKDIRVMEGNEAVAEGAIMAGVRVFAGYPVVPPNEISEAMSRRLPGVGGIYLKMEDETAGMAVVASASMGGFKAMTAASGPGFSLMQENIDFASMTELPCVIVDVMNVGRASGMPAFPILGTFEDHPVVVLSPSNVKEAFELTVEAVNISERFRVPVILLSDTVVGHTRERIELPDPSDVEQVWRKVTRLPPDKYEPYATGDDLIPEWADRGNGYRYHLCSINHSEWGFPDDSDGEAADALSRRLRKKMDIHQDKMTFYNTLKADDAEILFIAYGCVARFAKEAVRSLRAAGIRAGLLQLKTLRPFPKRIVKRYAETARRVIVPEMSMGGQLIDEVSRSIGRGAERIGSADGRLISPKRMIDLALHSQQ